MGESARGYKWPPFEPANQAALVHGARSERRISPLAERLAADAVEQAPWLGRPSFAAALAAWARAEAKALLIAEDLDVHGLLDSDGDVRPAANHAERLEASAARRRAELGLTPASFAGLLQTFAGTAGADDVLDQLRAEGLAIMTARQTAYTPISAALPPGDDR